ncbi:hypothetical protein [Aeromonas hydrophila]|uniref:hypothetical protein n=1 Tax=Aeromonas hydrophila TaxID=644 RepID=UPI0022542729|nr:hypothetical protein [Aeromonas hydrophila]MCX4117168.1 hypothetical protein [Aeromonas hydrophila]
MKSKLFIAMSAIMLGGCSSGPDATPYPEGELVSVNGNSLPIELIEYIKKPVATYNKPPVSSGGFLLSAAPASGVNNALSDEVARKVAAASGDNVKVGSAKAVGSQQASVQSGGGSKPVGKSAEETKQQKAEKAPELWPMLRVGYGETPLIAIKRWALPRGYSHVITDVSHEIDAKLNHKFEKGQSFADTLDVSLAKMSDQFAKDRASLRFYVSKIADEKTIVIHDKGIGRDAKLFKVERGSLMDNAYRLAEVLGWQTNINSWPMDTPNPDVSIPFNIVVFNDPLDAFQKLFARYQIQAQLVQGSNEVYFVQAGY